MRLQRPVVIGSALITVAALVVGAVALGGPLSVIAQSGSINQGQPPIQHVVIIFQENVSFDHYFGTYPHAANPSGEPHFTARSDTPTINGLSDTLLVHNPNQANPT